MELAIFVYVIETLLEIDVIPSYWVFVIAYGTYIAIACVVAGGKNDLYDTPFKDTFKAMVNPTKKWAIIVISTVFVLNLIGSFIPSKDTAYKMAAAYGVGEMYKAASQSEEVQRLTAKSLQVLEASMDKYLEEPEEAPNE